MIKKSSNETFSLKGRSILQGLVSESKVQEDSYEGMVAKWIDIDSIRPNPKQPRQYFSQESLDKLSKTFLEQGFKGAINVRELVDETYEIVAGERRWRAAKKAGISQVRCIVDSFTDEEALEFALIENLQRDDLSKLEETEGILNLIEAKLEIDYNSAIRIIRTEGHSDSLARSDVAPSQELNKIINLLSTFNIELQTFRTKNLQTLSLPDDLKIAHLKSGLSYSSALELKKLKDDDLREEVLESVLKDNLSFRQTKELVKREIEKMRGIESRPAIQQRLINRINKTLKQTKLADHILGKPQKRRELESLLEKIEELLTEQ